MFWLTTVSPAYQMIESAPIQMVDALGVRYRGWIFAKYFGSAPLAAIESDVRVVGRIVVCVEAAADVRTAMIRMLLAQPSTPSPSALRTSSAFSSRNAGPAYASAAMETIT